MMDSPEEDDRPELCLRCGKPREPELTACRSCGFEFAPPMPALDEPLPDDSDEEPPLPTDLLTTLFAPTLNDEAQLAWERGRHMVLDRIKIAAVAWLFVLLIPIFGVLVVPIALLVHAVMGGMVARRTGNNFGAPTVAVLAGLMALFNGMILLMVLGTMSRPGEFFGNSGAWGWLIAVTAASSLAAEVRVFSAALDLRSLMERAQEVE